MWTLVRSGPAGAKAGPVRVDVEHMTNTAQFELTSAARLLAVKEVHDNPGIAEDELAACVRELTGLADGDVSAVLSELEQEGHLAPAGSKTGFGYMPGKVLGAPRRHQERLLAG